MENKHTQAILKNLHIAPRKVRLVASTLKGMHVQDALSQLDIISSRSTGPLSKLIRSSIANAKEEQMNVDKLIINSIRVDSGARLKRTLPRSRGRATLIEKKMSHITVRLVESDDVKHPVFVVPEIQKKVKEFKEKQARKEKPERKSSDKLLKKEKKGFAQKVFRRKSI